MEAMEGSSILDRKDLGSLRNQTVLFHAGIQRDRSVRACSHSIQNPTARDGWKATGSRKQKIVSLGEPVPVKLSNKLDMIQNALFKDSRYLDHGQLSLH